jgi:hypothetical protein
MVDVLGSPDINRLGQRPLIVRRLPVLGNPVVTVNREPGLVPDETSRPSLSTVTAQLSCRKSLKKSTAHGDRHALGRAA